MTDKFNDLIRDAYAAKNEHQALSGTMYGAVLTTGFWEIADIDAYVDNGIVDMLHLSNRQTEESLDIYRWELEDYKVKRGERRIYIKLENKPEQSIMF